MKMMRYKQASNKRAASFVGASIAATILLLVTMSSIVLMARCVSGASLDSMAAAGKVFAGSEYTPNLPRNDPEFDLEALKQRQLQLLRYRRHAAGVARNKQLQQQTINNEADVAASLLAASNKRQQQQQGDQQAAAATLEDELALRRRLPELIAQAHNDKVVERALLKMLISASLRSALSNMATPPQSSSAYYAANNKRQPMGGLSLANPNSANDNSNSNSNNNNWQDAGTFDGAYDATFSRYPYGDQYANLESLSNDLGQSLQLQDQSMSSFQSAPMDKREYIKPCSFNAISCAKNPFRKL